VNPLTDEPDVTDEGKGKKSKPRLGKKKKPLRTRREKQRSHSKKGLGKTNAEKQRSKGVNQLEGP